MLSCGFRTGEEVSIKSKRLCLDNMPGIVTGDLSSTDLEPRVRVRVVAPWSSNVVFTVWAKPGELKRRKKK